MRRIIVNGSCETRTLFLPAVISVATEVVLLIESNPVHVAAGLGMVGALEVLASYGADLSRRTAHGATALHEAAASGHTDALRYLITCGLAVNEPIGASGPRPSTTLSTGGILTVLDCSSHGTLLTPVSLCGENNSEILELLVQQGGVSGTAVLTSEGQEEQLTNRQAADMGDGMGMEPSAAEDSVAIAKRAQMMAAEIVGAAMTSSKEAEPQKSRGSMRETTLGKEKREVSQGEDGRVSQLSVVLSHTLPLSKLHVDSSMFEEQTGSSPQKKLGILERAFSVLKRARSPPPGSILSSTVVFYSAHATMLAAAIIGGLYIEYGAILSVDLAGTPLGDKATEVAVKVVTDTAEELKRLAATADKEWPDLVWLQEKTPTPPPPPVVKAPTPPPPTPPTPDIEVDPREKRMRKALGRCGHLFFYHQFGMQLQGWSYRAGATGVELQEWGATGVELQGWSYRGGATGGATGVELQGWSYRGGATGVELQGWSYRGAATGVELQGWGYRGGVTGVGLQGWGYRAQMDMTKSPGYLAAEELLRAQATHVKLSRQFQEARLKEQLADMRANFSAQEAIQRMVSELESKKMDEKVKAVREASKVGLMALCEERDEDTSNSGPMAAAEGGAEKDCLADRTYVMGYYKGWKKERSSHQPALVPSVHSHQHSKVHIQALNFDVMEPKRIRGGLSTSPSRAQYHTLAGSVHRHGAVSRQFKLETPADMSVLPMEIISTPRTGNSLDPLGDHCVTCKRGGDVTLRHNAVCDVLFNTFRRAGLSSHLEVGSGWGQDCSRTRSADILVTNWDKATRMQVHPNSRHFGPLESCLRASAATAAAPAIRLDSPKMAGVRDDVTVISSAAGLPLSHPAMRISAGRVPQEVVSYDHISSMCAAPSGGCVVPQEVVSYDHITSMSAGPSGGCVVPQEVVSYDHITSMSAGPSGGCVVTAWWPRKLREHMTPPEVSNPSHHLNAAWYSLDSRLDLLCDRRGKGVLYIGVLYIGVLCIGVLYIGVLYIGVLYIGVLYIGVLYIGVLYIGVLYIGVLYIGVLYIGVLCIGVLCIGVLYIGVLYIGVLYIGVLYIGVLYIGVLYIGVLYIGVLYIGVLYIGVLYIGVL
eukprot:Em0023g163a